MSENIMKSLEKDIEPIVKEIILGLRSEKKISPEHFNNLYSKLNEYKDNAKDHNMMFRSFVGKLFYLFSTMVLEAKYTNYDQRFMEEVFRLRVCLLSVFDETNFNN